MTAHERPIKVMFVCLGNICRSPMAEAVFLHLVKQDGLAASFGVASSAVGNWHVGERPHSGTQNILKQKNVPLDPEKRAMVLRKQDFKDYDYILALDKEIVSNIQQMYGMQVKRLMDYAPQGVPLDVPDPYYNHNFDVVFELVLKGCTGLLAHIRQAENL
jgi:protein-tyrosine phosphatase